MRKIINFFSIVLFLVAVSAITCFTIHTLKNKGIREEVEKKELKSTERISSNMTDTSLAEIFNFYLNNEKHKLKFDYNVTFIGEVEKQADIGLVVYFDGESILNEKVASGIKANNIDDLFKNTNVSDYVRITSKNIKVIKDGELEYLVLDVGYYQNSFKEVYFVFDNEAHNLIDNGILVRNDAVYYVDVEDTLLDIFYGTGDSQILAKIDGNVIYSLQPEASKNVFVFHEYKYFIQERKLKNEIINNYVDIKLKDTTTE